MSKEIRKLINEAFKSILKESYNDVEKLQKKLKEVDDWFYNKGKGKGDRTEEQWEEKKEEASKIRQRLFVLTGDSYGETKESKEKRNKIPDGLDSGYNSPEDVPVEVYRYIFKHKPLLTSDATDAVRWSRIINSRNEQRYPSGKINIYRAVDNRDYDEIREGDWVTTDESYAIQHNNKYFDGQGKVISMVVDGRDVLVSPTGNDEEAIYAPAKYSIDVKI